MTAGRSALRRTSIRVALGATLVVALAYLVISGTVLALATSDLTQRIDRQLLAALEHIGPEPEPPGGLRKPPPGRSAFGPILLVWRVDASGAVTAETAGAALPEGAHDATAPETVSVNGEAVRVVGADTAGGRVVLGQSLEAVAEAQGTILLAELLIAPVLLGVVFVGALAIGHRVAGPIERARRRQLDFTADASHELRTPVAVIEAQTSLALAQDRSADWYRSAFERVGQETKRMRRLVDDLLWLARFDAGAPLPEGGPVDLGVIASGAADRFAIVADAKSLSLSVALGSRPAVADVPAEWADRLLAVLLDNACKYAPSGGRVEVRAVEEGGRAAITVDDSGPGIDPAARERILDRFHRATDASSGAGLGLAIADAIVRATNGRWRIGTSPLGGASLSVSWQPALHGPTEQAPAGAAADHDGRQPRGRQPRGRQPRGRRPSADHGGR
jgi:signal transduction histidine kinase